MYRKLQTYFVLLQLYCAQWFGKEHIMCGGCEQNTARIIDRGTLNVRIYDFTCKSNCGGGAKPNT